MAFMIVCSIRKRIVQGSIRLACDGYLRKMVLAELSGLCEAEDLHHDIIISIACM